MWWCGAGGASGVFRPVLVLEHQREDHGHHQGIGCEGEPRRLPLGYLRRLAAEVHKVVYHRLRAQRADGGSEAVGHDDEQPLRARADVLVRLAVDEQRTRDVEEVEGHAIDNHREDEHPHAAARIARSEEAEAQHPCQHGDEHHVLDAEAFQEERYQQDAERLGHLRERYQDVGMLHAEGVGILGYAAEAADVGVGKAVGNLQRHAQQHGEEEEDGHFLLAEQGEGAQPQRLDQRLALSALARGAGGEGQRVEGEHQPDGGAGEELPVVVLQPQDVDRPHGADEADGAEDADGGKVPDGVEPRLVEGRVGHGVREGQRGHVEGHAQGVEGEEGAEVHVLSACHAVVTGESHEQGRQEVAQAQQLLGGYPAVGDDAQDGGHEEGHDALHGIEDADVRGQAYVDQVAAHGCQIGSPHGKLQEVHDD